MALQVAGQTVVVTLGITIDGTKVPLGSMSWASTENDSGVHRDVAEPCSSGDCGSTNRFVCVVDGGKGIRKALVDVLGDLAGYPKMPAPTNSEIYARTFPSPVTLRAPDNEGSVQMQEA